MMRKLLNRQGERTDLDNNVIEVGKTARQGNRRDYGLERLERERRRAVAAGADSTFTDALDQAMQGKHGGDRKSDKINVDNVNVDRPAGNSESAALRRLRKDWPDLHARKTERDQLRADVIDAWLNCVGSNRELADAFAVDDKTVGNWTAEFAQSCGDSAPESRQHFDIWQFATADKNDGQQSYFGAVPPP